jgi:SAM-dependent methyltransferase
MSLQDVEDYEGAISEVARVLKDGGRFVFSVPHLCFEVIVEEGNRISATARYFGAARYPIHWRMERLLKPFETTSFHRTLTDYSAALFKSKLLILRLVEPRPTRKGLQKHPPLREVLLRPQSVVIESMKIK